jgi:RNA polymerase subunit RPABC4/transcription elongation factor Spt4
MPQDSEKKPGLLILQFNGSHDWSGYVVIIDPEKSQIAKRLGVKLPGEYALKVR